MKFRTSISKLSDEDVIIRQERLSSLVEGASFSETIFLLLTG